MKQKEINQIGMDLASARQRATRGSQSLRIFSQDDAEDIQAVATAALGGELRGYALCDLAISPTADREGDIVCAPMRDEDICASGAVYCLSPDVLGVQCGLVLTLAEAPSDDAWGTLDAATLDVSLALRVFGRRVSPAYPLCAYCSTADFALQAITAQGSRLGPLASLYDSASDVRIDINGHTLFHMPMSDLLLNAKQQINVLAAKQRQSGSASAFGDKVATCAKAPVLQVAPRQCVSVVMGAAICGLMFA